MAPSFLSIFTDSFMKGDVNMNNIQKRLLTIKILDGMKKNPEYSKKIGLEDKTHYNIKIKEES